MNIFHKIYQVLAGNYTLMDRAFGMFFSGGSYTQKAVTETSAMQLSAVWGCVRLISETLGSLPLAIYQSDGKGNSQKLVDHPLTNILSHTPNADMTAVEMIEALAMNLAVHGNGYAYLERNSSTVTSLYPMPSTHVTPKRLDSGRIVYDVNDRGKTEQYPAEKILHIKGFGTSGLIGLSPIAFARNAIGLGMIAEEYGSRFFANGGRPSGILKIPTWLKKEQREEQRAELERLHGNIENSSKPMLLEGGIDYTPISFPPEDAQFIELRKLQVIEICRIFRVPPHLIADLERATLSNVEQQSLEFVKFTLKPYLTRFEQAIYRSLLTPKERQTMFARFNLEGLLRGDTMSRATFYSQMLQNGVYTRNEVRALENMNRVDGADELTVQVNMSPLDQLGQAIAQAAQRPQPAATTPPAKMVVR